MRANQTLRLFAARIDQFSFLSQREKGILVKRIFNNTLEKIGNNYDLSAERIRQIELEAIDKIKTKSKQLNLFD